MSGDEALALLSHGDAAPLAAALAVDPALRTAELRDGATLLHLAAQLDRSDLIEVLLSAGAALEARDRRHDSTALAWAAYYGSLHAVQMLVRAGADRSVRNRYRLTPRQIAEGGARGEHAADAPGRTAAQFAAIVAALGDAR
jgi:ankyrin repeat protein